MTVRQIMNSNVVYLTPDDTVTRASKVLSRHNIGMLPVCTKDGKLLGVVTDRDITLRCIAFDNLAEETKLREIMTRGIITISPEKSISDAIKLMSSEQIRRLPVIENNKIIGILSLGDIAQKSISETEISKALCEISTNKSRQRYF